MESIYLEKLAIAVKADDSPNPNPYPRMKAWEWAEDAARFMDENFA